MAESADKITVTVELPGLEEKDLDISISQTSLTIKGEKKEEKDSSIGGFHQIERRFGSFQRVVSLPCPVETNTAEARFKRGVLKIVLPKSKTGADTRKKIAIKQN